jgi:hypothetical protein
MQGGGGAGECGGSSERGELGGLDGGQVLEEGGR